MAFFKEDNLVPVFVVALLAVILSGLYYQFTFRQELAAKAVREANTEAQTVSTSPELPDCLQIATDFGLDKIQTLFPDDTALLSNEDRTLLIVSPYMLDNLSTQLAVISQSTCRYHSSKNPNLPFHVFLFDSSEPLPTGGQGT